VEFEVSVAQRGSGIVALTVHGELDLMTAPELRARLKDAINDGSRRILLDLSDVSFLDSTTLGVLMSTLKELEQTGGALVIVCDTPGLLMIFKIAQLLDVLEIVPTADAGIALLQGFRDDAVRGGLIAPV
jgi:anti-sigma B factor antagonist